MAQVTGMTAAEINEEIDPLLKSGRIDAAGNLLLTTRNGAVINAGPVGDPALPPRVDQLEQDLSVVETEVDGLDGRVTILEGDTTNGRTFMIQHSDFALPIEGSQQSGGVMVTYPTPFPSDAPVPQVFVTSTGTTYWAPFISSRTRTGFQATVRNVAESASGSSGVTLTMNYLAITEVTGSGSALVSPAVPVMGALSYGSQDYTTTGWEKMTSAVLDSSAFSSTQLSGGVTASSGDLVVPADGYYMVVAEITFLAGATTSAVRRAVAAGLNGVQPSLSAKLGNGNTSMINGNLPATVIATDFGHLSAGDRVSLYRYTGNANGHGGGTGRLRLVKIA